MTAVLLILALTLLGSAQETSTYYTSTQPYTTPATTASSYVAATTSGDATSLAIALPTMPFTGQALIVGTCSLPVYTMIHFPDGGALQVPLIGCSDERPECCPSLNLTHPEPEATGSGEDDEGTTTSWTGTTPSPTPTGIVSLLSKAPLSICPSDMIDLDPVCCPIGYAHYGQPIIGNLPCVSTLTSSVISVPNTVLASISSAVAESLAGATDNPTVSVIINQVFALGLPCADNEEGDGGSSGLSTGAKAGIGAGIGVVTIAAVLLLVWLCLRRRKHRREANKDDPAAAPNTQAMQSTAYNDNTSSATGPMDPKHASALSTMSAQSPQMRYDQNPGMHQQMQQPYPGMPYQMPMQPGMQGYGYPQAYSPTFGYIPNQQQMMPQEINPHFSQGYGPVMYPGYGTGSPPPPFYNPGPGSEVKPVEVDSGQPVQRVTGTGGSVSADTQSQVQSKAGEGSVVEMGTESMRKSGVSR